MKSGFHRLGIVLAAPFTCGAIVASGMALFQSYHQAESVTELLSWGLFFAFIAIAAYVVPMALYWILDGFVGGRKGRDQ